MKPTKPNHISPSADGPWPRQGAARSPQWEGKGGLLVVGLGEVVDMNLPSQGSMTPGSGLAPAGQ